MTLVRVQSLFPFVLSTCVSPLMAGLPQEAPRDTPQVAATRARGMIAQVSAERRTARLAVLLAKVGMRAVA